jgi:hypothetical protein
MRCVQTFEYTERGSKVPLTAMMRVYLTHIKATQQETRGSARSALAGLLKSVSQAEARAHRVLPSD